MITHKDVSSLRVILAQAKQWLDEQPQENIDASDYERIDRCKGILKELRIIAEQQRESRLRAKQLQLFPPQ